MKTLEPSPRWPFKKKPRDASKSTVVSVVSHGQGALVAQLLGDIARHWDTRNLSVIVTVNLPEALPFAPEDYPFPVLLVENRAPKGFGANHNAAFALSCCELFCVINPDIRTHGDPLPPLARALARQDRLALAAPRITGTGGAVEDSARRLISPGRILRRTLLRQRAPDYPIAQSACLHPDWVAGMFMLIDARAFAAVEGFDERYFMYCEDADLCTRLWRDGRGVALVAAGPVEHAAQRASHASLRHLLWHTRSLLRFFVTFRAEARTAAR